VATKTEYDWLMGASGAAFDVTIDLEGFDPLAATPRDPDTLALAARAAAVRLDDVPPPYDDDLRDLVGSRIREAIDDKLPPLIRGAVGPPARMSPPRMSAIWPRRSPNSTNRPTAVSLSNTPPPACAESGKCSAFPGG